MYFFPLVYTAVCNLNTTIHNLICHAHCDFQAVRFLGVDFDDGQLQKANENVEFAELGNRLHLLKASSMGKKPAQTDHWNNVSFLSLNILHYWY